MIKKLSIICIFVGTLTASEHNEPNKLAIEAFYPKKHPSRKELVAAKHAAHFAQKPAVHSVVSATTVKNIALVEEALTRKHTRGDIRTALEISRKNGTRDITDLLFKNLLTLTLKD